MALPRVFHRGVDLPSHFVLATAPRQVYCTFMRFMSVCCGADIYLTGSSVRCRECNGPTQAVYGECQKCRGEIDGPPNFIPNKWSDLVVCDRCWERWRAPWFVKIWRRVFFK
jgi:hypothetical protein